MSNCHTEQEITYRGWVVRYGPVGLTSQFRAVTTNGGLQLATISYTGKDATRDCLRDIESRIDLYWREEKKKSSFWKRMKAKV